MGCVGKANTWIPSIHLALIPIANCLSWNTLIFFWKFCVPHQTSSLPRSVLTEQCISKAFISPCVCAHFSRRNPFFTSPRQCISQGSFQLQLCPLCHRSQLWLSQKEELRTVWGKVGRTTFLRDSHFSAIGNIHPSPTQIYLLHRSILLCSVDIPFLGFLAGWRAPSWWFFWWLSAFLSHQGGMVTAKGSLWSKWPYPRRGPVPFPICWEGTNHGSLSKIPAGTWVGSQLQSTAGAAGNVHTNGHPLCQHTQLCHIQHAPGTRLKASVNPWYRCSETSLRSILKALICGVGGPKIIHKISASVSICPWGKKIFCWSFS